MSIYIILNFARPDNRLRRFRAQKSQAFFTPYIFLFERFFFHQGDVSAHKSYLSVTKNWTQVKSMKGREYHEAAFVGVVGKNIETEGGDKLGKVTDVLITKGTKEIVLKVSQGLLKSDMVVPWSKALKVTEDTVVVSDRYYEGEAEGEVELH